MAALVQTGADLRAWRRGRRLSVQDLADRLGSDERTLRRWESGELSIPPLLPLALEGLVRRMDRQRRKRECERARGVRGGGRKPAARPVWAPRPERPVDPTRLPVDDPRAERPYPEPDPPPEAAKPAAKREPPKPGPKGYVVRVWERRGEPGGGPVDSSWDPLGPYRR